MSFKQSLTAPHFKAADLAEASPVASSARFRSRAISLSILRLSNFATFLGLLPPLLIREVFDVAIVDGDTSLLNWLFVAMVAAAVGDPAVFVSVAAIHQGPSGGGPVAAIVVRLVSSGLMMGALRRRQPYKAFFNLALAEQRYASQAQRVG